MTDEGYLINPIEVKNQNGVFFFSFFIHVFKVINVHEL